MGTRQLNRLSAKTVASKKHAGLYCDGGGLYLQVTPSGSKTWIFRYRSPLTQKLRDMGLGPIHSVGLPEGQAEGCGATCAHYERPGRYRGAGGRKSKTRYRLMSLAERGLLDTLRNQCWVTGSIPEDPVLLSRLTSIETEEIARNLTARVRHFFEASSAERGRLVCPELLGQRANMLERSAERARAGKKGAKAKWDKEKHAMAKPTAEPSPIAMASVEKRRTELSREETNRKASSGSSPSTALSPDSKAWVEENEKTETLTAEQYRKASRG